MLEWMTPAHLRAIDCGGMKYTASKEDDIFSLGILIYYIYSNGKHPFGNPSWQTYNIRNNQLKFDNFIEENFAFQNLVRAMINNNPKKRPNIEQVLKHPFFWSYKFSFRFIQDVHDKLNSYDNFRDNLESRFDIMNDFRDEWNKVLDSEWTEYLNKPRTTAGTSEPYQFKSFVNLLAFIVDKFEERTDWATEHNLVALLRNDELVVPAVDESSYMRYFVQKFPNLILVLATTDGIESLPLNDDFTLPSRFIFELGLSNNDRGAMREIPAKKIDKEWEEVPKKKKPKKEKSRQVGTERRWISNIPVKRRN